MIRPTDPRTFMCWPCLQQRHEDCRLQLRVDGRQHGCECFAWRRLDGGGLIVLCPSIFAVLRGVL